jgi:hypothetical protein
MLVRLGLAAAESVPAGQRLVRAAHQFSAGPHRRAARRLGSGAAATYSAPQETSYAHEEPTASFDARRAQQAAAAYRAADLVQPRPGLFLHVQA